MADDFARFDLTHTCPGCGEKLTRIEHPDGSLELLHPRPICGAFAAFVLRLIERQADQKTSS